MAVVVAGIGTLWSITGKRSVLQEPFVSRALTYSRHLAFKGHPTMNKSPDDTGKFVDSEAGQIAAQFDISIFKAREIMGRCASDTECIKELAEEAHRKNPQA